MLWTDAIFITPDDLTEVDPDVMNVAESQDIDLPTITQRAIEEAGNYLEGLLVSFATYISSNDLSANHLAAVFYTGSQPNQRRRVTSEQLVVTGRNATFWSEIKQWAVNRVLIRFYRSAGNRAEGDRYLEKMDRFKKADVLEYLPALKFSGIPIVYRPMPTPGAIMARNAGTWAAGQAVQAGCVAVGQYDVTITYVDYSKWVSPANDGNLQSNPAATKSVTLVSGNALTVDITALNPPTGSVYPDMLARGYTVTANASHYNVWAGQHNGVMYLQNPALIPITQKTFALTADPAAAGFTVGIGQYVEAFLAIQDLIQRG